MEKLGKIREIRKKLGKLGKKLGKLGKFGKIRVYMTDSQGFFPNLTLSMCSKNLINIIEHHI